MRARRFVWIVLFLLCLAGAWLFWPGINGRAALPHRLAAPQRGPTVAIASNHLAAASTNGAVSTKTNQFPWRLSNTTKSLDQLVRDRHAILLENALMDSSQPLTLSIPNNLRSPGDPGAYIVQARGPIDAAFRAMLAQSGAQIVAYIPNNAYLVYAPAGVANGLTGNPLTQSVTSYEPYYKISSSMSVMVGQKTHSAVSVETNRPARTSLLELAVNQLPLPAGTFLTLGLFKDNAAATIAQIEKLGGTILARDNSPFGPVVRVQPPADWVALAILPGVQIVEPYCPRVHANDLSRATVGVAADTQVATNYLGLSGSNVLVQVNDSGIDATHPDFTANGSLPTRILGAFTTDTDGHGTHVAGIIAGDGSMSMTVSNAQGSIMPGTTNQFRGMATNATLLAMDWNDSDQYLQENAAQTNALISNNSWNYGNDYAYDLAAASYDAAARDALPGVTGSQPVLFVFSAGNDGGGNNDGGDGNADTILSPATAKNVITVGALEQLRSITNIVTDRGSNQTAWWQPWTDSSSQVAGFSSRGNVGVGTEGTYGRFKPDVVAPGTFVVSTRSSQWDQWTYYNPTNYHYSLSTNQVVDPNTLFNYGISIPINTVGVFINIWANRFSQEPFPTNLPIYVRRVDFPTTNTFDFVTWNNGVSIPPDSGGSIPDIISLQNGGFYYSVGNTNSDPVNYDLTTLVMTTNDNGNYFQVLSNLNQSIGTNNPLSSANPTGPGPYYRYESGTSMAAADVSGVLALMQDYFTNTLHIRPSPALMKAMLIAGARSLPNYGVQVTNMFNFQGWGLVNLPNSLPSVITTNVNNPDGEAMLILEQSPTNALATGDSHTYEIDIPPGTDQQYLPLQVTLTWTDPPGDPAAAIKLVNNLDLVVSNADTGDVFFGNDIGAGQAYNTPESPTNTTSFDAINNVENVFIQPLLGTKYFITVIGRGVNVNAVTAHTNNVVQDFALVIACGEGEVTNAFTVVDNPTIPNPTAYQDITYVITTNAPLFNQMVGASTPLLGTNQIQLTAGSTELNGIQLAPSNVLVTLGMTNQWHFYVVTNPLSNPTDFTNAAFITFIPATLSLPRMGVYGDNIDNATRPEADIDMYVSTNSALTNLDPVIISNADKSVGRGGTEFVFYTNSAPGDVYYIGVYSEDQEASEYGFIPIFTDIPFSQMNPNGSQTVNGLALPVNIPDGNTRHPGVGYVFALATEPMLVKRVVPTTTIQHLNFGDLIGTLTHGQQTGLSKRAVLNNHESLYDVSGIYTNIYDDSGSSDIPGARPSKGPGSLNDFLGQQAIGPWILTEVDDSQSATGAVTGFQMLIEPHQGKNGATVYGNTAPCDLDHTDFIDVPAGATNLTIVITNLTPSPEPISLYVKLGGWPTTNNFDVVTNVIPPATNGAISIGPPLSPGRYYYGVYTPCSDGASQSNSVTATYYMGTVPGQTVFTSTGSVPLLDDAVTSDFIDVPANQTIASVDVGLRVDHPRVSDLVFHLISPDGTRVLLVENRGGVTTNGLGASVVSSIFGPASSAGGRLANTNTFNTGQTSGQLIISYDFFGVPDQMTIYESTNPADFSTSSSTCVTNTGMINLSGHFSLPYISPSGYLTIIMNQFVGNFGTLWNYTASVFTTNYLYLTLTENTNLTTTPIKFAPPPFVPSHVATNLSFGGFESAAGGEYVAPTNVTGWGVTAGQVSVVNDVTNAGTGSNFLALALGTITNTLPTVPGVTYTLTYDYRGPGIVGWWRGEGNTNDELGLNNAVAGTGLTYAAAEVGQGFVIKNTNAWLVVSNNPALNVGAGAGLTLEAWINPTNVTSSHPIFQWLTASANKLDPYSSFGVSLLIENSGVLFANLVDVTGLSHSFQTPQNVIKVNVFTHVALTYNSISGMAILYTNGVVAVSNHLVIRFPLRTTNDLWLGYSPAGSPQSAGGPLFLNGILDEPSVYNRALSASEIKAIYSLGSVGKFDPNSEINAPQNLAEASVTIPGIPIPTRTIYGDNTTWRTGGATFTAITTNTPVIIAGLEPGILLDNFFFSGSGGGDLYYLPEQSLDTFQGENALGEWQLEVQDDRVGASNNTPSLLSWQLRFNFATTSSSLGTLNPGVPQNNLIIPPGAIQTFQIQVPCNADIATNTLLSASGPLNLLFDAANPPTGTTPPDYQILGPATSGSAILYTNSAPASIEPCGTYYLGVQNPGASNVTYGIVVNFHTYLVPTPPVLPNIPEQLAFADQLLTVTNTATDTNAGAVLVYLLTTTVSNAPLPVIDASSGIITWTPTTNQVPAVYTFTTIVTDTTTLLSATNSFNVLALLTNGTPAFPGAEGAGGFAVGGRGGDVYHVINVNDDGPGSLRYGVNSSSGNRTIVFDVSGAITLLSELQINQPYLTIAAQTAPGAGITIQGLTTSVEDTHDLVVRFLRCRPGDIYVTNFQDDSFHFLRVTNSIADHISASWSVDEVLSTTHSTNVTVQWSMIAEPLDHSGHLMDNGSPGFQEHGYGSLIRYGYGAVSYHHNLYADNYSRNPRPGDNLRLDFINNVVCNWGNQAGYNEDDTDPILNPDGYTNFLNYVGNYFIAGSNSANPNIAFRANVPSAAFTQIYQGTNFIDGNQFTNVLGGSDTGWGMFAGTYTQLGSPTPMPEIAVTVTNPPQAYEQVLAFAGATVAGPTAMGSPAAGTSLLRDPVDTNIVNNVRHKSGQIIDFISSNSFAGVFLSTNFGATWSGDTNAAGYWVAQGLTNFVGVNPWPVLASAPQPLDSDGDGIPDYWDITLNAVTGDPIMNPSVPHNNRGNPDGYTDLEHYLNWLAAPHALTVSNTPVDVDLYAIVGRTGNLTFGVTNGTNGTVSLGIDGHTATFTPTNTYFGFASFDFSVTNLATTNSFDVTVSVMVSITNITTTSLPLTNAVPQTNTVPAGGFTYYLVAVPPNAQLATNILSNVSGGPLNLWFSQSGFPTGTNAGDYILLTNSMGGLSLLGIATNFIPTNIIAGGTYYLGVQNLTGVPVDFGIEVDFYPPPPGPPPPPSTNIIITSITYTNINGTNGFLLQWQGPTNYQYEIQWKADLLPAIAWNTVLNPVINFFVTATNGHYRWFDDGTLTGGFDPVRFYRILGGLNLGPITGSGTNTVLPGTMSQGLVFVPTNAVSASNLLVSATGPLNVWLNPTNAPTGNPAAGDFLMLSATNAGAFVLDSSSVPPLVPGTNYYLGFQNPGTSNVTFTFQVAFGYAPTNVPPPIPVASFSVIPTNGGFWLLWNGLTNYQYQIQWTTNLAPLVWNTVLNPAINVTVTATNGHYSWLDDGTLTGGPALTKFYRIVASANLGTISSPGPATNTVLDGTLSQGVVSVPINALWASNVLLSATGPLNVWLNPTNAPVGNTGAGDFLMLPAATSGDFVLTSNSVPPLVPGADYYLGFQNPGTSNVTFTFEVTFGLSPPAFSSILLTNGLFQLQWIAPTNYQFQVAWTTNLASSVWNYLPPGPPYLTSTNVVFTFVDTNPPVQMKFYRLVQQYP